MYLTAGRRRFPLPAFSSLYLAYLAYVVRLPGSLRSRAVAASRDLSPNHPSPVVIPTIDANNLGKSACTSCTRKFASVSQFSLLWIDVKHKVSENQDDQTAAPSSGSSNNLELRSPLAP